MRRMTVIPEPQHAKAAFAKVVVPCPVVSKLLRVLATVELDHHSLGQAREVRNVRADGVLPAELVAAQLAPTKVVP